MKRRFAVLTVLGALLALAVPASSMAAMYPAGHKFEIVGGSTGTNNGPKVTTSLGSCSISKITVQIPAAPANETNAGSATVTPGACSSGTTLTVGSSWSFSTSINAFQTILSPVYPSEGLVLRFSSLPGCKLVSSTALVGIWSNGVTTPKFLSSGYHAHSGGNLTWANDGGTCALAGKTESAAYENQYVPPLTFPGVSPVNNLTSPTTPIIVGPPK